MRYSVEGIIHSNLSKMTQGSVLDFMSKMMSDQEYISILINGE